MVILVGPKTMVTSGIFLQCKKLIWEGFGQLKYLFHIIWHEKIAIRWNLDTLNLYPTSHSLRLTNNERTFFWCTLYIFLF